MNKTTNEKIRKLVEYLAADGERAKVLLAMPAEEACERLNADGLDLCAEELQEFSIAMEKIEKMENSPEELSADALEEVTGGGVTVLAVLEAIALLGGVAAAIEWFASKGVKIGKWIWKKIKK